MNKNKNPPDYGMQTAETVQKIRGDWGNVNPVTKIIPNKKKTIPRKQKYKVDD